MSAEQEKVVAVKEKVPRAYIPLRAEKIERGKSYVDIMVNSQKTMLENLRFIRLQMEKEERQLQIMQNTLYDRSLPKRWSSFTDS